VPTGFTPLWQAPGCEQTCACTSRSAQQPAYSSWRSLTCDLVTLRSVKRGGYPEGGLRSENAGKPLAGEEIKMADLGIEKGKGEVPEPAKKAGPGRPKKDASQKKEKS